MAKQQKKIKARVCRVILPEGERSEPEYFKMLTNGPSYEESKIVGFARHYPSSEGGGVVLIHRGANQGGWSLKAIIKEVKRIRELLTQNAQNLSYYEFWAVFDADDMSAESLLDRLAELSKSGAKHEIHVAISIPCFEAFLLAHFMDAGKFLEAHQGRTPVEIRRILQGKLQEYYQSEYGLNYEKQIVPQMIDRLDTALANIPSWSKKARLEAIKSGTLPTVACSIKELIESIHGGC